MRCITARILAFAVALGLGFSVTARAVDAASPLVTIPVGQSVNYHITSHADMGIAAEQHDNYVAIYRASPTVFNVKVDGAPAGSMGIDTNGNLIVPAQLTKIMGPFQQMAAIMRSAPQPLDPTSSWVADMPVLIQGVVDNVPLVVSVTQLGPGVTIQASGQDSSAIQQLLRSFDGNVSVRSTIVLGPARIVRSATSSVDIAEHVRLRTKHSGAAWTVTAVGQ